MKRALRNKVRLKAAETLAEDRTYAGFILALGAAFLSPQYLERVLSRASQSLEDATAMAGLYLMGHQPRKTAQTWPPPRGWTFLEESTQRAMVLGQSELVYYLSKASTTAPLFLASLLAAVVEAWDTGDPRTLKVARNVVEKAVPLAERLPGFRAWIQPREKEAQGGARNG